MYSKELEEFIEIILADQVITEKERSILHKKGAAEGIDPDELDIVIEGRLAKLQKIEKEKQTQAPPLPPKSNKYGEIRKCPQCGAVVEAGSVKCIECGYNFVGISANSSREKLKGLIDEITNKYRNESNMLSLFSFKKEDEIKMLIRNFPIPTTKEDLLEFTLYLAPLAQQNSEFTDEYKAKYLECIGKIEVFFNDDPTFYPIMKEIDKHKNLKWGQSASKKPLMYMAAVILFIMILAVLMSIAN